MEKPVDFSSLFTILLYEFNEILGDRYRAAPDKEKFGAIVRSDIAMGEKISRQDYERALTARAQLAEQFKEAFLHADALTPTMPTTSPVLDCLVDAKRIRFEWLAGRYATGWQRAT